MRGDVDRDEGIACPSACARPPLHFQSNLLPARNAGRDLDLDVFAGRQMNARLCTICSVLERDGERGMQILPRTGACTEILALERRTESAPRAATRGTAKHPAQKFV